MSNNKVAIIKYSDGFYLDGDIMRPVLKDAEILVTGTKRFHNCLYLILGLNRLQRMLIDWLSEEMDDKNMVNNDKYKRGQFIEFISKHLSHENKVYKDQSVANAFHGLVKAGLLKQHSRMYYQVNPLYYWKGTDKARIENIMMNIKFESKNTNFKVFNLDKYEVRLKGKQ